jgi:hypothetical protein
MSTLTRPKTPDRRGRKPPTISIHQSNIGKLRSATANRRVPANSSQIQTIRRPQEHNEKNVAEREEEENDDDDDDDVEVVPADPCEPRLLMLSSAYQRQNLLPCSDKFDPFASLPTSLNRFQEHLISFYLFHYPHATYGFNPRLKPHPVATNFTIALTTPACFQTILSRAALYRGSLKTYGSDKEKKALELAMLRHKVEAIRLVHGTSVQYNKSKEPKLKDDLLASIMALGNLDRRSGSADSADMHYTAIRRILKATGGPLAINNPMLNRVSVFFECIYGTSPQSYIWEKTDFPRLVAGTNDFLQQIRKVSNEPPATEKGKGKLRAESLAVPFLSAFCLRQETALYICLSKGPHDSSNPTRQDHLELIWQLTCLLMLASIVTDYRDAPDRLQAYMSNIYKVVEDVKLSPAETSNNLMWLIQISDLSEEHSKRILRSAESAWICKHLKYDMQAILKRWLLQFLTGHKMEQPLILDIYHFSYAS